MIYQPSTVATEYGVGQVSTTFGNLVNDVTGATHAANINSHEAAKQRAWEKMMSDTQYQRAVADLKAAGLNPAMMYASGGSGAGTPSGASATSGGTNGNIFNAIGAISGLMNSITSARNVDRMSNNDEISRNTTTKMYNNAGKLFKTIVQQSNK